MITQPLSLAGFLDATPHTIAASLLLPNERVIHVAAISPLVYWKSGVVAVSALVTLLFSIHLAAYFLLIGLGLFLLALSARKYLLFMATDQRLLIRGGIMNVEVIQFSYDAIESIEISSMLLGQIFGYGSIIISGTGKRKIIIPYIENAGIFENIVIQKKTEGR